MHDRNSNRYCRAKVLREFHYEYADFLCGAQSRISLLLEFVSQVRLTPSSTTPGATCKEQNWGERTYPLDGLEDAIIRK